MIRLKNISKTFHRGEANEVKALADINLEVPRAQFLVLVGANGSGKSTLLNVIAGSIPTDQGEILIEDQPVTRLRDFRRSRWIARIFQNPLSGTAPELSVLDNFRLAALRTRRKGLQIGIRRAFHQKVRDHIALLNMGLENKLDQAMGTLSGGQRQALTLIMAIMDEAKILLLDEPSAALDPRSAQTLMSKADMVVREFSLTAILVTHDLRDAHQYGDRIIQMQQGKIFRDLAGSAKSTLTMNDLFQWFA